MFSPIPPIQSPTQGQSSIGSDISGSLALLGSILGKQLNKSPKYGVDITGSDEKSNLIRAFLKSNGVPVRGSTCANGTCPKTSSGEYAPGSACANGMCPAKRGAAPVVNLTGNPYLDQLVGGD